MGPEDERQSNPFLEQLKSYGASLPGRLIQAPVRAAKLPFQLLQEVTGMGGAGEEVESLQRSLATQVTGKEVPYSEGRRYANAFSLGLIPNNKYPTINPQQLGPEEQQRFKKLTPLQQRLLQSKRPRDFADMLNDDSLFAEREAPPLQAVKSDERLVDEHGQIVLEAAPPDSKVVTPGSALVGPDGTAQYTNEWVDPSLAGQRDAAAEAARAKAERDLAEAGAVPSKIAMNEAKAAEAQAKADAEAAGPGGPTLGDRSKIGGMEARVNSGVAKRVGDLDRGFTAARNANELFELRDANKLPATYRRELIDMGFDDLESRDPRSVQDLMFMTMGIRIGDPYGKITDKDSDMYSRARAYFDPGIIEAIKNGQVLTNAQRSEMMVAIKKITTGMLATADAAVVDGRKTALRDLVLGGGVGMNPMNIQDSVSDIRQSYYGKEFGDQAAYPAADRETEQLLEQLWDIKNPGKAPTASDLVRFANEHGFRVQEFEQ